MRMITSRGPRAGWRQAGAFASALTFVIGCGGASPLGPRARPDGGGGAGAGADASAGSEASAGAAGTGSMADGGGAAGAMISIDISADVNRNVDIVFMIDNSFSMAPLQRKLADQIPTFMNVLTGLPGGLPNVHIGVVTSDLGAGQFGAAEIQGCRPGGDQGKFQSAPVNQAACAKGMLNAGQNFLIASSAAGSGNFTGDLADAFSCIALVGDQGCGFEHQLGSVLRALGADGAPAPAENASFLRPDALLVVVLLTNEDDCTAPPDSTLYDPSSRLVSDPLGPLSSYRCNEFGHLCGGRTPPRTSANNAQVDLSGSCVSNENGPLIKVADAVTQLKATKVLANRVLVATIAAPPNPYIVAFGPPGGPDPNQWPFIQHSCTSVDGTYGDPAVRLSQWTDAFSPHEAFQTICADSFAPALQAVAVQVGTALGAPCVNAKVELTAGTHGPRPDCEVVDHVVNDEGVRIDTPIPSCVDTENVAPCWTLAADPACASGSLLSVSRPAGLALPAGLDTSVQCAVCAAGSTDATCL